MKSEFTRDLIDWYRRGHRELPWRRTRDPYRVWVSEIMLQQTQVTTVLPYYERFLALFPTVDVLAEAAESISGAIKAAMDGKRGELVELERGRAR